MIIKSFGHDLIVNSVEELMKILSEPNYEGKHIAIHTNNCIFYISIKKGVAYNSYGCEDEFDFKQLKNK